MVIVKYHAFLTIMNLNWPLLNMHLNSSEMQLSLMSEQKFEVNVSIWSKQEQWKNDCGTSGITEVLSQLLTITHLIFIANCLYDTFNPNILISPNSERNMSGNMGSRIIPLHSVVLTMVGLSANRKWSTVVYRVSYFRIYTWGDCPAIFSVPDHNHEFY